MVTKARHLAEIRTPIVVQIKTLLFEALSLRYIWLEGLVTQLTHFFAEDAKFMGMTLLLAQYPLPT
ncbi:hypothetical protein SPB21_31800 [Leptothoe sp. ISB3NOV94-8A]